MRMLQKFDKPVSVCPQDVTPQSWFLLTVQIEALMPGVCPSTHAAGVLSCMWSWLQPRREEEVPTIEEGEEMDWNPLDPWVGSQNPHCEHRRACVVHGAWTQGNNSKVSCEERGHNTNEWILYVETCAESEY